ncbi:alpha/beta hydrolase [Rhodocytophaga rosea]|uniref:Alpha/beta hydrolase n=1 Tax=Rhodocytophaga rosea TaxID=2704465 RepID=A0A6C0GIH2_9BACT|nr:alpha/beta hydrolase [Rhodocytophaga rosea]QHT67737.1 alpha/beta hydrolase [Rhodocytophaga rosea]
MRQSYIHLPATTGITQAVTLVVHGLNNKPSAMMPLADRLRSWGSDVLLVQLTGHTVDSSVTPFTEGDWCLNLQDTFQQATTLIQSGEPKPLYFLGYSLGALLNLYLILSHPGKFQYDKMVLLAPAFALRKPVNKLLQLATDILPAQMKIPSFTPKPYRAGTSLPVKAYTLLNTMAVRVEKSINQSVSMPVLVMIHPKDEMVSVKKMNGYINEYLPSWQLYTLPKTSDQQLPYAHLILDERSVGKENWDRMLQQIRVFLQL